MRTTLVFRILPHVAHGNNDLTDSSGITQEAKTFKKRVVTPAEDQCYLRQRRPKAMATG